MYCIVLHLLVFWRVRLRADNLEHQYHCYAGKVKSEHKLHPVFPSTPQRTLVNSVEFKTIWSRVHSQDRSSVPPKVP